MTWLVVQPLSVSCSCRLTARIIGEACNRLLHYRLCCSCCCGWSSKSRDFR